MLLMRVQYVTEERRGQCATEERRVCYLGEGSLLLRRGHCITEEMTVSVLLRRRQCVTE